MIVMGIVKKLIIVTGTNMTVTTVIGPSMEIKTIMIKESSVLIIMQRGMLEIYIRTQEIVMHAIRIDD